MSGLTSFACNDVKRGLLASQAIIGSGRQPVAVVTGSDETDISLTSFVMAWQAAGQVLHSDNMIKVSSKDVGTVQDALKTGEAAARRLCSLPERPHAVWVADDVIALGMLRVFESLSVRVPEDVLLVVSTTLGAVFPRPVIRVAIDPWQIGRRAVERLGGLINGGNADPMIHYVDPALVFDPGLVVRPE